MMKLKIGLAFLALYLVSLLLTAPATLVTRFIPANAGIQIGQVSGSIWNAELSKIDYRKQFQLKKLTWNVDWLALFTLKFKMDITFNNGRKVLNGSGSFAYGFSGVAVSDLKIDMQAQALMPYLKLPVPVTPSGEVTLVIENGMQGSPYCQELDGYLVWHEAKVETPMGDLDFATPHVNLRCAEGGLVASLKQNSEQLITNANILLSEGGNYQLEGSLIGREKLPPAILQAISWLGPKTESGETMLNFKGKL